jgi:hypothetical protein
MKRNLRSGEIDHFNFRRCRHGYRMCHDALYQKEKYASPQPEAQTSYLHQMTFLIVIYSETIRDKFEQFSRHKCFPR